MNARIAILAALLLSGCATVNQPATLQEFIQRARALAIQACGFEPTVATITNIFAAGQFTTAFAIADQICKAVVVPPGARVAKVTPRVGKVVVRGRFVR